MVRSTLPCDKPLRPESSAPSDTAVPADWPELLALAQSLRETAATSLRETPLRDVHVALLCAPTAAAAGARLTEAARGLGARVAQLPPLADPSEPALRMLARLYRAIACEGLDPDVQQALRQHAGLPVCVDFASNNHEARILGDVLALQAHSSVALPRLGLGLVIASDDSALAQPWHRAAALTGLHLRWVEPPDLRPASDAFQQTLSLAKQLDVDVICNPALPRCSDGRAQLWWREKASSNNDVDVDVDARKFKRQKSPRSHKSRGLLHGLGPEQGAGHHHLVQALLLRQIG